MVLIVLINFRISGVLSVVIIFYATVSDLLGSGPIWKSTITGMKDACQKYWYTCLLFVQNYFNPSEVCVVQTWYLTCDMQFYFLSPIILYPLWKWPHFGVFWYFVVFIGAVGINFEIAWKNQFKGGMPITNELLITKYFTHHYTTPYTRASPYLVGIAMGYILYNTRDKKIKFNSAFSFFGWVASLTILSAVVFGCISFQLLDHPFNRLESSIYLAFSRPTFVLALSWVIFNCVNGTGGFVNTILSSYILKVIARLSYCMFLTHLYLMFAMGGAEKTTYYFSNFTMTYMFFGDMAFSFITSYVLSVCVEIPIIRLDSMIRKKALMAGKVEPETEKNNSPKKEQA